MGGPGPCSVVVAVSPGGKEISGPRGGRVVSLTVARRNLTSGLEQRWVEGTRSLDRDKRNVSLEKDDTVAPHTPDSWTPIDGGRDR